MTTSTAPSYTDPSGTPFDADRVKVIEQTLANLRSGRYFRLHAASGRSAIGCRPPTSRHAWSHCIVTVGRMAAESDALAQVATAILGHVNLYGTHPEADAQVFEAAAGALDKGFDDVIGRAGPEAGRHRDHHRDFSLAERVLVAYWLATATAGFAECVPGVGWALDAIARAHGIHVSHVPKPETHRVRR